MNRFKFFDLLRLEAEGGSGAAGGGAGEDPGAGNQGGAADPGAGGVGDQQGGDASQPYRPEGLADHYFGETNEGTIDNLMKAVDGYRERDSNVPEDPSAYSSFDEESVPETLRPHINELANDPLFARVSETAKELKMPVGDFQKLTADLYTAAQDAGLLEAPIDVEAEREALTPEHAKHLSAPEQQAAREKRMNENYGWLDLLAGDEKSGVNKDLADFVKVELGDSAMGHQFFEAMRNMVSGSNSGPGNGGSGSAAQDEKARLDARVGLPKNDPNHREFDRGSYEQLKRDLQAYHARHST